MIILLTIFNFNKSQILTKYSKVCYYYYYFTRGIFTSFQTAKRKRKKNDKMKKALGLGYVKMSEICTKIVCLG